MDEVKEKSAKKRRCDRLFIYFPCSFSLSLTHSVFTTPPNSMIQSFVHYFSTYKSLYLKQKLICFSILSESHWMVVFFRVCFFCFFLSFTYRAICVVACDFLVLNVWSVQSYTHTLGLMLSHSFTHIQHNLYTSTYNIQNNRNVFTDRLQLVLYFFSSFYFFLSHSSIHSRERSGTKSFSPTQCNRDCEERERDAFLCVRMFVYIVFGEYWWCGWM